MEGVAVRYVGIDLGKRSMDVHFVLANNKHQTWSCKTDVEGRARLLRRLGPSDVVAMEGLKLMRLPTRAYPTI